jgi:hypothetical protein
MSSSTYCDDQYNRRLDNRKREPGQKPRPGVSKVDGPGFGTLIGNWYEESVVRDSTGIGRSLPIQHKPRRAKLLKKSPELYAK